jgi:hypothetical protein
MTIKSPLVARLTAAVLLAHAGIAFAQDTPIHGDTQFMGAGYLLGLRRFVWKKPELKFA